MWNAIIIPIWAKPNTLLQHYFLKDEYFLNDQGGIFIYINAGDDFTTEFLETGVMNDIGISTGSALAAYDLTK